MHTSNHWCLLISFILISLALTIVISDAVSKETEHAKTTLKTTKQHQTLLGASKLNLRALFFGKFGSSGIKSVPGYEVDNTKKFILSPANALTVQANIVLPILNRPKGVLVSPKQNASNLGYVNQSKNQSISTVLKYKDQQQCYKQGNIVLRCRHKANSLSGCVCSQSELNGTNSSCVNITIPCSSQCCLLIEVTNKTTDCIYNETTKTYVPVNDSWLILENESMCLEMLEDLRNYSHAFRYLLRCPITHNLALGSAFYKLTRKYPKLLFKSPANLLKCYRKHILNETKGLINTDFLATRTRFIPTMLLQQQVAGNMFRIQKPNIMQDLRMASKDQTECKGFDVSLQIEAWQQLNITDLDKLAASSPAGTKVILRFFIFGNQLRRNMDRLLGEGKENYTRFLQDTCKQFSLNETSSLMYQKGDEIVTILKDALNKIKKQLSQRFKTDKDDVRIKNDVRCKVYLESIRKVTRAYVQNEYMEDKLEHCKLNASCPKIPKITTPAITEHPIPFSSPVQQQPSTERETTEDLIPSSAIQQQTTTERGTTKHLMPSSAIQQLTTTERGTTKHLMPSSAIQQETTTERETTKHQLIQSSAIRHKILTKIKSTRLEKSICFSTIGLQTTLISNVVTSATRTVGHQGGEAKISAGPYHLRDGLTNKDVGIYHISHYLNDIYDLYRTNGPYHIPTGLNQIYKIMLIKGKNSSSTINVKITPYYFTVNRFKRSEQLLKGNYFVREAPSNAPAEIDDGDHLFALIGGGSLLAFTLITILTAVHCQKRQQVKQIKKEVQELDEFRESDRLAQEYWKQEQQLLKSMEVPTYVPEPEVPRKSIPVERRRIEVKPRLPLQEKEVMPVVKPRVEELDLTELDVEGEVAEGQIVPESFSAAIQVAGETDDISTALDMAETPRDLHSEQNESMMEAAFHLETELIQAKRGKKAKARKAKMRSTRERDVIEDPSVKIVGVSQRETAEDEDNFQDTKTFG